MLKVGLTGDLGSGKSTVGRMLAERGAFVFSSDEMGRQLMQPGQDVYIDILRHFGSGVLAANGTLDRAKLAAMAFDRHQPRVEELNAIIHPAVLKEQARRIDEIATTHPDAIVVVESALIFSTKHVPEGSWRNRFDRILLVEAPEADKIARFADRGSAGKSTSSADRSALEADARRRLAVQHTFDYAADCTILHNDGDIDQLEAQVDVVWQQLTTVARNP